MHKPQTIVILLKSDLDIYKIIITQFLYMMRFATAHVEKGAYDGSSLISFFTYSTMKVHLTEKTTTNF